jgi:molybdate transport system substrate-binding protein
MMRLALLCLCLPVVVQADDILVFAPASLGGTLDRVVETFEGETGHEVTISYAGTSALAFQIRRGAPADIFISASTDWMDDIEAAGLIVPDTRRDVLANALVLVATENEPVELADLPALLGDGRLAMALTNAVPAGQYGREALEALNLWEDVAPRVVETDNVRAALRLVALGEAALGVVYQTDAIAEDAVSIVAQFPQETHRPILYPAALLSSSAAATDFLDFLGSSDAQVIFVADGFAIPPGQAE